MTDTFPRASRLAKGYDAEQVEAVLAGLNPAEVTVAEVLKQKGYATALNREMAFRRPTGVSSDGTRLRPLLRHSVFE